MTTPMVVQYEEIKARHQDAILFFRLGDFYEMFKEDALLASRELEITLTSRTDMPMCGVPHHAAQNYIARLIEKGYKVAICEQTETPDQAKGVVKREVVKIVTPGTVVEAEMLAGNKNNYLAATSEVNGKFGLAYVDISTGQFKVTEFDSRQKLDDEILRVGPVEVIKTQNLHNLNARQAATAEILNYLKETQKVSLGHITEPQYYEVRDFMLMDASTRRNLELVETIRDKNFQGSLLWVLDQTKTNLGGRLLRQWILQPLLKADQIHARLDGVEELLKSGMVREKLGNLLKQVYDIERLTSKVAAERANARDLIALKNSLELLPHIKEAIKDLRAPLLQKLSALSGLNELTDLLRSAIIEEPPLLIKEGGMIRRGYNEELDKLKEAAGGGKQWIAELENAERMRTGIRSLKVGYTRVFGYYLEISHANKEAVPADYIRKQTLVNAERYITPELKEKESFILNADERMKELEYQIFCEIRNKVAEYIPDLQSISSALAELDAVLSLAQTAAAQNYCRPQFVNSTSQIKEGRHPVIEKTLGSHKFVPNDLELEAHSFLLITGPNMAGKSTYMRQAALISIMAQIGSFVPAKEAQLGIVDRIFTRVGAMDDIFSGQSTFMLEMTETANILQNATERSLIILDEIGRGTATFDGMSIAAAVAEYIHTRIRAKTLFATHYHEITQLADKHPGMRNISVSVLEENDQITFLHKIVESPADKSYGIAVAKLAGLPAEVIQRAKEVYDKLEMVENDLQTGRKPAKKPRPDQKDQMGLFA